MSPRTGRPISGTEARTEQLVIRLTPSEKKMLNDISALTGMSKTQCIIKGLELLKSNMEPSEN